ncbi:MAG: 50S ribosomal protein L18e [Candidatus Methanoliparum thermophilum]|uniref:Large ribosomal subunit protein eL18 n=1 Tax=Methanoliparum thermophilum TaxID=2491083 RepID=A0A520KTU8_METT2|nr:50S ribosomal protein L18e [Candidatus Methanoliparum sp. LAM-1]RZN65498.1 MAG: 50S ribosomal protein L18e [Candidatus Methanoliparum thermophilum]BDC35407.1 50S ribosomal protein L18e [Candidatus Methanoliparum sp. LAM-1]
MKIRKKSNPLIIDQINKLLTKSREENAKIWKDVAQRLNSPTRSMIAVNIGKINRYADKDKIVLVPGKVLGSGTIDHPVTVSSINFSKTAYKKIIDSGGRCLTIDELVKERPKGSNVVIIQ